MRTFYVSRNGKDTWSGTLPQPNGDASDGPFASLALARDAVRALKAVSGLPHGGVTVVVAGGEYRLHEPLAFAVDDSGTAEAPVVYRAADGETVRLSGGVRITDWYPVDDPETLARLHPEARGHVLQADLRAHGVTDFGAMGTAPQSAKSDPGLEVFFRDKPMTLARYPNEGFMHIAGLSVDDGQNINGIRGSRIGRFRVEGEHDRLRRWANEPELMLHGYWFWDWAEQRIAVTAIDPDTGEFTLDDSHPHGRGYRVGQWFYAFNLLCELDRPGEWYLDRTTGILYFWSPASGETAADTPDTLAAGDITVSIVRDPIRMDHVSHLMLQGFTIEMSRGTGVQVTGGEAVRIAGCTLLNLGADAVRIEGGRRHAVSDCDICQTGDGGIMLTGGDRRTLTPGEHEAVNNHIHHIARWNTVYKVGIQLNGCGNRAAHNRLHDLPHIAINFTGNDQLVEYNEIYQSVTRANDAGAIYTSPPTEDWTMRGHRIRFNYLHHIFGFRGMGCNGIYLDDRFSGTEILGNILCRVFHGFLLNGGRDILSTNNVFVDCPLSISLRGSGEVNSNVLELIGLLESMPYREEPWASRYPELLHILDDEPALPKGNVIARNIFRGGMGNAINEEAKSVLRMEYNLDQEDPHFVNEDRLDFRLCDDSPARKLGFEPIPVERIGLQLSPLRSRLPLRRQFDAELIVEQPPVVRAGRCIRPGVLCVRLRNIGDATDSCRIRLQGRGARVMNGGAMSCTLAPFAIHEQRHEVWTEERAVDIAVVRDGVDGVLGITRIEISGKTPCPTALRVSVLQPGVGRLDDLDHVPPDDILQWQWRPVDLMSHFCNARDLLQAVGEADAVIFFGCRMRCAEPMRVAVLLGYDGPVKLFVDGVAVFHDPAGSNPARADSAASEVELSAGEHELTVALGANCGLAYGIFLRLWRVDFEPGPQSPILPETLDE